MQKALDSAGLNPSDIDYISAWGPGHPVLDRAELDAIHEVFGEWAQELPISSIKGVIGNPFAGAGPAQVIAVLEGLREQVLPPTANLEIPIEGRSLRLLRDKSCEYSHNIVLINAHGIGGANTSLIIQRIN
jgi:3-oxoacyl-[acyl-carrier-protein] synthase II